MNENKKGGKRAGAGRKPVENPKVQVTIYVEQAHINNFGGITQLKEALCGFAAAKRSDVNDLVFSKPKEKKPFEDISGKLGQSIEYTPMTAESYDSPKIVLQDTTAPNKDIKPITDPKPETNYTVDTRPKTYEELKAMCPPEIKGMERTFWLAEYREKYGV